MNPVAEYIRAISNLDVDWARKTIRPELRHVASREALLMGLHLARYSNALFAAELRHASGAYLRANGYEGPLLPEGQLP